MAMLKPITQQIYYTPESREAEYELLPLALDQHVGTLVWGPMGEGLLTGSTRRGHKPPANTRQGSDWPEPYVHNGCSAGSKRSIPAVKRCQYGYNGWRRVAALMRAECSSRTRSGHHRNPRRRGR